MSTSEIPLQLCQWGAKRQFCTSNTAGEGDKLALGKGDRQTDTSETSLSLEHRTGTANATTQEGASLNMRQYYAEYYYFNTPVGLHRTKQTGGSFNSPVNTGP